MADEITLQWAVNGSPEAIMAVWRSAPPGWVKEYGYKQIDESYNSLIFEARKTPKWMTLTGMTLFSFGMSETVYRLTVVFEAGEPDQTKVTVDGHAYPKARAAIAAQADESAAPPPLT